MPQALLVLQKKHCGMKVVCNPRCMLCVASVSGAQDSVMALPGALYPQHLGMPSIEEAPDGTVVQMVPCV